MVSEFLVYLRLGFEHIADLRGYDHLLFVAALCAAYPPKRWRRLLVLVTSFTVGHSITLALATLRVVRIDDALVELLIPATILATSVINVVEAVRLGDSFDEPRGARVTKYLLALGFGLIHGLGFSNFLRALLGAESSITLPLFAFNVGLELGQIGIVLAVLLLAVLMVHVARLRRRDWILVLSGATAGISILLMVERLTA